MMNSSVLYHTEQHIKLSVYSEKSLNNIHKVVSRLYQVDVHQSLVNLQQQVLAIIATELNIKTILWHANMAKNVFDIDTLLQENGLLNKKFSSLDIILNDSNIHHSFFVVFSDTLSPSQISNHYTYLSTLLPLIAEIYRQTVIRSYYQEWKNLPFKKHQQIVKSPNTIIGDIAALVNEAPHENWKEIEETNQKELVRVKRVENQLFVDKFIMPKEIQSLTFKQKQVCFFLKACCSNQQIAKNLNISVKTVGNHLAAIYEKLNISRSELFKLLNSSD